MDRNQRRVLRLRNHVLSNEEQDEIQELAEELADAGNLELEDSEAVREELEDLTVKELKELASASGVVGYSSMNKEELIQAIEVL